MANRRDFFKTVAGAAAGMYVAGRGDVGVAVQAPAGTPPGEHRRQARARRRHPLRTRPCPRSIPSSQNTEYAKQGGGRPLGPDRVALIDKQGIDVQALSINGFWWYEVKDRDLADRIVRAQNEGLAKFVAQYPDRFVGMASSSLQFPDLAAQQLEDGVKRLGLRAAAIGGHVNGEDLSLPEVRSVLGQGGGARRRRLHAPGRRREHHQGRRVRGPRRSRQHHRQPARDDVLPVAADLRRHARQVPGPQGVRRARRRLPAVVPGMRTDVACEVREQRQLRQQEEAEGVPASRRSSSTRWSSRTKGCATS